ncbi:hypothetical protein AV530_002547 [Patagioenas fasciata monilis]|uniref:Uncharacterized protein n=1 Tax=Patagioenas fasciata monilis TaxID=372326 RepID=A0A1V4K6S7_PATFA|nr:hypothetical protein AV530_002547 [Patagioenas fasciata monilis]
MRGVFPGNLEDAASVGRGPGSDPAGAFGGRSSSLQPDWPPEFQLDGWRHTGGITFVTCSSHLEQPHRTESQSWSWLCCAGDKWDNSLKADTFWISSEVKKGKRKHSVL